MNITAYQSSKAWPDKRWLAYMELAPGVYMPFFGKTEDEAIKKANSFWERETERQKKLNEDIKKEEDKLKNNAFASAIIDEVKATGRGAHFVGKVWMIHMQTRNKIRIDSSEVSLYEGRGYVRGGPRSK